VRVHSSIPIIAGLSDELIAMRVAQELRDGDYVNLGVGIPTLASSFLPAELDVMFHSENGMIGFGPLVEGDGGDPNIVNASSQRVKLRAGACFFNQAESFAIVRSGRLDVGVLGAYQVSEQGDLANWKMAGPNRVGGIGGAMDVATGAKRVIVAMRHVSAKGESKVVRRCSYPLTARSCVSRVITNLAVLDVVDGRFMVREVAPGVSLDEVQASSDAELQIDPDWHEMRL
jgi:3-oxoacid CoA-transferase B subunit